MKEAGGGLAENGGALGRGQRRVVDDAAGFGIADRKRVVGAEHDAVGASDVAQKAQSLRLEHDAVEIEPGEPVRRVGEFALMDGMIAPQPPERVGKGAAAMGQDQGETGKARQMTREQQSRHRDRRVAKPADGVQQIVAVEPLVGADILRVQKDHRLPRRSGLPERVERGIVEIAARSLRLGRQHRPLEALIERLLEHARRERPVLQWHRRQRRQRRERGCLPRQVLVEKTRPVGAFPGRQFIAEDVGPAADQLMVDARLLEPVAALFAAAQARQDRPRRRRFGKGQPRRRAFGHQPDRWKQTPLGVQGLDQALRDDMSMAIDDHLRVPYPLLALRPGPAPRSPGEQSRATSLRKTYHARRPGGMRGRASHHHLAAGGASRLWRKRNAGERVMPTTDHDALLRLAELRARAEALVPALRERALQAEQLRRLPDETVADLHASGLFRMLQPTRVGGGELPYRALCELTAVIAEGCGSTAWVLANLAAHHWLLGMWPPAAQDEIWGESPDSLISSALIFPRGRAQRVPGGYRLSGRWPFSSGIDCANWNMIGALCIDEEIGRSEPRIFLLPASDYRIIDTWQVIGLAGTGSKDVEVSDVFVPHHRTLAAEEITGGPTPGSAVNPSPLYRLPAISLFAFAIAGVSLGIARGAIRDYTATTRTRLSEYTGKNLADFSTVQVRLAEAAPRIDTT